jgi:5-methylthioadenosine/S-adenosylhomocysteine deaminase
MVAAGLTVGIGTDGTASNNTLDLLRDTQLTALLHKGVTGDPTALPARKMIEMATIDGARVLGLDDRIGTLVEGKQADVVCIELDHPHAVPMYDPYSHLVFAARASDVRHVLVAGQLLVGNRELATMDRERIASDAKQFAEELGDT